MRHRQTTTNVSSDCHLKHAHINHFYTLTITANFSRN